jgi:hypothetical protein
MVKGIRAAAKRNRKRIERDPITERDARREAIDEADLIRQIAETPSSQERVNLWLASFGITYDPFRKYASELDTHLEDYYLDPANFDAAFMPAHSFVYAKSGAGKTAAQLRLATHFQSAFLADRAFSFAYLIPDGIAKTPPPTLDGHIPYLIRAAVRALFAMLAELGNELLQLDAPQSVELVQRLIWYFDKCYPLLSEWRDDLSAAIQDHSLKQALASLDFRHDDTMPPALKGTVNMKWLIRWQHKLQTLAPLAPMGHDAVVRDVDMTMAHWQDLRQLMHQVGIRDIVVLVDGVDAKPGLSRPIQTMQKVAEPLAKAVTANALGDEVFLKLFLPIEIWPRIMQVVGPGYQRFVLEWQADSLKQLISKRLSQASSDLILSVNQLAEKEVTQGFNLEDYLIEQSGRMPRQLIHTLEKMFETHVNLFAENRTGHKISFESIDAFLQQYNTRHPAQ